MFFDKFAGHIICLFYRPFTDSVINIGHQTDFRRVSEDSQVCCQNDKIAIFKELHYGVFPVERSLLEKK